MFRIAAVLLLSASGALAEPIGFFDERAGCHVDRDGPVAYWVTRESFLINATHDSCGIGHWQDRGGTWVAYFDGCTQEGDEPGSSEPLNWSELAITEQANGRYLFELTGEGGGEWTAYKCEEG